VKIALKNNSHHYGYTNMSLRLGSYQLRAGTIAGYKPAINISKVLKELKFLAI
jgi:hypothetical protein